MPARVRPEPPASARHPGTSLEPSCRGSMWNARALAAGRSDALSAAATIGAGLLAIAAKLHRAPGRRAVRRVVVERPAAVAASLQARPAAVEHRAERGRHDAVECVARRAD